MAYTTTFDGQLWGGHIGYIGFQNVMSPGNTLNRQLSCRQQTETHFINGILIVLYSSAQARRNNQGILSCKQRL